MEDTPTEIVCPSCAQPLLLSHGANCGEQRVDAHSRALSHFFHDAPHESVYLDSKIFGTFWNLLRRPGLLTADYWRGRRLVWIRPLRLFLVIAAVHLSAVSSTQLGFANIGKAFLSRLAHAMAEALAIGIAVTGAFFWTASSMPH